MIPRECRRLAEVDFPIAEVSKHAVAEQSARRGHPKGLHKWWARRPLASSRAMLLALLLPDPADENCPAGFRAEVRRCLVDVPQPAPWHYSMRSEETEDEGLRRVLLGFIADFAAWGNASGPAFLKAARALIGAAHGEDRPQVVDPFAGGGSIPLEALRLGCDATATDLNPVACLILKTMLEDLPRARPDLASEILRVGEEIREAVREELADLYPPDPDGEIPITYLWARTVRCEAPGCGAEIPLLRSLWLSKKRGRWSALSPAVHESGDDSPPQITFRIFAPESARDVRPGTVHLARATCLACKSTLPPPRVRAQLATQRGGADVVFDVDGRRSGGAMLTSVVIRTGGRSRSFRLPTDRDYDAVKRAQALRDDVLNGRPSNDHVNPLPGEPLPPIGTLGFRVQRYGMLQWRDMFTARQGVAMVRFCGRVASLTRDDVRSVLAMRIGTMADGNNALCRWKSTGESSMGLMARSAVQPVWDFAESTPASRSGGVFLSGLDATAAIVYGGTDFAPANVQCADATEHPLPDGSTDVWFTDPPYYDSVPYADLSDFFFVWLKRCLPSEPLLRDRFDGDNPLSPKSREAVQDGSRKDAGQRKDKRWFESKIKGAFAEGRRVLREGGVGSVVFAHTTTDGWEALLAGLIKGGWTITGSWPIATELPSRLRARDSAALATSVHLVLRPRPGEIGVGDWESIRRELPRRVGAWMEHLQGEGIRGSDLVFACIGPALEIFSRYRAVETVDGTEIPLRDYLRRVWDTVGQAALQRVLGDAGSRSDLEEDARLTALFLWTMQSSESGSAGAAEDGEDGAGGSRRTASGSYSLPFDVVRRFAQPMGIDLDIWTDRIVEMEKGVVRLLPVASRAGDIFGAGAADASEPWGEGQQVSEQMALDMDWHRKSDAADYRRNAPVLGPDARIRSAKATTLDRVHAAMLLQSGGRSQALRTLLIEETARGPEFLHLANALSALYPRGSEEKRLLDAMLLAVPR